MKVFAVWEPILPIDWSAPSTAALHRLSDRRVIQFWDKDHVLAKTMSESRDPSSRGGYRTPSGILWDTIAVYPRGAEWGKILPPASVFDGPVVAALARSKIL